MAATNSIPSSTSYALVSTIVVATSIVHIWEVPRLRVNLALFFVTPSGFSTAPLVR